MKKLYFIVGSQDLYGEECLKQVAEDSRQMVAFLNEKVGDLAEIELLPTVETSEICIQDMRKASNDDDCVGVITWMHTFSPAKMWIKGLQELRKPLLHLHTQANEKLPYDEIPSQKSERGGKKASLHALFPGDDSDGSSR